MSKSFDDLFNDFFKRNNIKPEDKIGDAFKNQTQKMIDMLTHFREASEEDSLEKQIDEQFGKPDKIEFYNEGDMFFERRTWHTADGPIVKTIMSDDPTMIRIPPTKQRLEEQLREALENEEYEKAAAIRDELKKRKKK